MVSRSQLKATAKYNKKTYDRIEIQYRKDNTPNADDIKRAADMVGESVNAFIKRAVADRIDQVKRGEIKTPEPATQSRPAVVHYKYGMRNRGYSPGCQPSANLIGALDGDKDYYNYLLYSEKLDPIDARAYELDYIGEV